MTEVTPLQQSTPKLGRLVVVGLGLIGGSFAKGCGAKGCSGKWSAWIGMPSLAAWRWSSAWSTVARRILAAPASAPT